MEREWNAEEIWKNKGGWGSETTDYAEGQDRIEWGTTPVYV